MSQVKTKFIEDDAVTGAKFRTDNDEFAKGRNNGDSANIDMVKVNTSDEVEFGKLPYGPNSNAPSADAQMANKKYVDDQLSAFQSGLDAQDSVLDKDLTAPPGGETTGDRYLIGLDTGASSATGAWAGEDGNIAEYNGAGWDFTTPLAGYRLTADDEAGHFFVFGSTTWSDEEFELTTGGTGTTLNSGAIDVNVDDSTIEVNGSDNLQVKASGIGETQLNNVDGGVDAESFVLTSAYSAGAGTVAAGDTIETALEKIDANASGAANTNNKESVTLDGTDITNQYVDLANVALAGSIDFQPDGAMTQVEGVDYTVNLTGGAGGNTRITFAGDLATAGDAALVATDVVRIKYQY